VVNDTVSPAAVIVFNVWDGRWRQYAYPKRRYELAGLYFIKAEHTAGGVAGRYQYKMHMT